MERTPSPEPVAVSYVAQGTPVMKLLPRVLALASLLALVGVHAASLEAAERLKGKTYHFGTHPARTNISFVSDADLETIHGTTNVLSGSIAVDAAGTSATGSLTIPVKSLKTQIDARDEHLRGKDWLDEPNHPSITMTLKEAKEGPDGRTWTIKADLTIKGVKRAIETKARVIAFDPAQTRGLGAGEWVRVRTRFDVKLSDHGIQIPQQVGAKVSNTWSLGVDIYGTTVKPAPRR